MARPLELGELIETLREEHGEVKRRLAELKDAVERRWYAKAAELVSSLWDPLRQHVIDEEAKVLKAIIDAYGREGARDAIEIAQVHREIRSSIEELDKLARRTPGMLGPEVAKLRKLLEDHFEAEENRMFPQALKAQREVLTRR
ncbi:MAG TPA: hemerythrin domain-containing protein [Thermoplasmata archaeon]|nr:hemerythrin domain-containing protein [Thermoplasmata archaeon]